MALPRFLEFSRNVSTLFSNFIIKCRDRGCNACVFNNVCDFVGQGVHLETSCLPICWGDWSYVRRALRLEMCRPLASEKNVVNLSRLAWGNGLRMRVGVSCGGGGWLARRVFGGISRAMGIWSELKVCSVSVVHVYVVGCGVRM